MTIADARERALALDVTQSFCVTAPAGSGKTELLIQRYLALLARVERPEQVLAITFTRKAAAEMRERVLAALREAMAGAPCEGEHQQVTRALAEATLAASDTGQWYLTRDISRLNIKTIDSFCAALTRQMPVLSRFGGQAQQVDDAEPLYREAVADLFSMIGSARSEAADLDRLLLHFDNNWDRLQELLVIMLGKRDQWYAYLGVRHSPEEAEQAMLATVEAVIVETLEEISAALAPWQDEILELLCYARGNLGESVPEEFPASCVAAMEMWRAIGQLFLTQAGSFRKAVDVRIGFPKGKGEPEEWKKHFKDLSGRLAAIPGLDAELQSLAWLPEISDNSSSWQLVLSLSHVLPLLAACLLLVFEKRGVVDHTQVALSALDALGDEENPTELALRLDYRIEHILVDEFQDTAINQYRLLERLTRGWGQHGVEHPATPRTVFIVGDGMQSIYGFRNANVGLFLKAGQEGFNGVLPRNLALRCNFRSQQGIVDWVNDTFRDAFPAEDNVRKGRVRFTGAEAVKPAVEGPAVSLNGFYGEHAASQEARWLVAQVQAGLDDPDIGSIALLGRSRAQLAPAVDLLRARGIAFDAQDVDSLAGSPAVVDLMTLCRALANPADLVAWFALLRAPWCGLSLADIHALAGAGSADRGLNLHGLLLRGALPGTLSARGRAALQRIGRCLRWADRKRDRLALRVWLEQLWLQLGGPACLPQRRHLADARRFFELVAEAEQEGIGFDVDWLGQRIEKLYAAGDSPGAKLQVMTLHKAKGLEFDWVLIPALARGTRGDSRDILLWDEYNSPGGERGFLLAADDHSDDREPGLYNYLKRQRREKSRLETTRLLYVGATRAIRRLTLSACLKGGEDLFPGERPQLRPPAEGSLLAPIWPVFREQMRLHPPVGDSAEERSQNPGLRRLLNPPEPTEWAEVMVEDPNMPERVLNRFERCVGTVVHRALEVLSGSPELPREIPPALIRQLRHWIHSTGLWGDNSHRALENVQRSVQRTLEDEATGRWLLSSEHAESFSELAMTCSEDGAVQDRVIDRTFVDRRTGLRWVVDYKSSAPVEGESVDEFTGKEAERYREQLRSYRDTVCTLGPQPVRCALYFTRLGLWHPLPELDT